MEIISNIIVEYLKHNKRLCVPKLGTFIVKQSSGAIIFSDLMRNDDGVLRALLTASGMHELEAAGLIDRFVFEVRHAITVNGKMKIEGLGEFSADLNNTISFTPAPRQRIYGGNIKPPVEVIQERIPPRETRPQRRVVQPSMEASAKRTSKRRQQPEDDGLTLGKPDPYLRGLKYDSNKNKKRDEMGHGKRVHSGGKGWIVILLLLAMVAGGAYLLLPRTKAVVAAPEVTTERVIESDTTQVDTLPAIDSLNTPEILEETLPTTIATPTEVINE